ncbi:MAG: hypothetical protein K0R15_2008 [Clostridiales bacterium]|jgi:3'-5' exoribonuclease|nr:hypothetical protein [Clostridiales bacterium]
MRYINSLREGEQLSEIYLVKFKQIAKTKQGKSYYNMILQDKTGTVDTKIWDIGPGIDNFEQNDYIMVEAQVTFFQSGIQLNVRRLRQAKEGEYDPKDYIPTSDKDIEVMYKELLAYISGITQPHLRKLAEKYFVENANFVKNFKEHSAAKSVHHSFLGGLLEHTLGILKLCEVYVMQYPILNKDLLYTAAMFHDVGKLVEISNFPENDYTDDGQLLGHIIIGVEWLNETMKQIDGFPPKLASMLKHCILSHHGELEYGSPKKPAIIEAIALHMADNTDSKLMTFNEILQSGTEEKGDWLGYNRLFESNLRKTVF